MNEIMNQAIDSALEKIKLKNCEGDIIASTSKSLKLSADQNELENFSINSSTVLGVRLIKDGRVGLSYSEALDDASLSKAVDSAFEAMNLSVADDSQYICCGEAQHLDATNEKSYRPEDISLDKKIELALKLESEMLKKDPRIKKAPYNQLVESETEEFFANTYGRKCSQKKRHYSFYTSGLMEEGKKQVMFYDGSAARVFSEIQLEKCIDDIYQHLPALLNGEAIKSGSYDILFSENMLSEMFGSFSSCFSGKGAHLKVNPFRDKIDQKVAAESFSLMDIPHFERAFADCCFDDEGLERKEVSLIENGVLKSFYHNSQTAKALGLENNHCASRSAKGHLGVSGTTKVISTGQLSEDELLDRKYLQIVSLQGSHSGVDVVSGDFSLAASGYLMEGDKQLSPVRHITLSGNFYRALKEIELADQLHCNSSRSFFAPKIIFKSLSVGGN